MKKINENILDNLEGLPINFDEPIVKKHPSEVHDWLEQETITFGNPNECEVNVNYLDRINSIKFWNDVKEKNNPAYKRGLLKTIRRYKRIIEESEANNTKACLSYYLVTPDLAISLTSRMVQAMITTFDSDDIIILYGLLNKRGELQDITICSYDKDLFCNCERWYDFEAYFCCDTVRSDDLYYLNKPNVSEKYRKTINFREFLQEQGLEGMDKKILPAIYYSKETIMEMVNKSTELIRK